MYNFVFEQLTVCEEYEEKKLYFSQLNISIFIKEK